jgi:glycosyltransferase involved in cell wall biosynthesis
MKSKTAPRGIVFVRNSDVRYDTRMRKSINEAIDCGLMPLVLGWVRDGSERPSGDQEVNGKPFSAKYFILKARFGLGLRNIFRLIAFNLWLLKMLIATRKSYEAIYVCDLDVAFPSLFVKFLFRKKIIYDIFDFYSHTHAMPQGIRKYVEKAEYGVCRMSDSVIVCTEKRARMLRDKTEINSVVIYNTPNIKIMPYKPDFSLSKNKGVFSIVYVGTLSETGRLLKEVTEKIKVSPGIELHVAGLGPLEDYIVETVKKFPNIYFYGQVTNEVALELQAGADILFATYDPSLEINRNSAPNKTYEAMALGKPIIVCRNTDADLVVTANESGYAIGYDAKEFMGIVHKYKNNEDLKIAHANNALALYREKYSWSNCQDRLNAIFCNI